MSVEACAALVARGDPDRHLAALGAPEADRARLWPLYAFNLELARAPWVSAEPLIGQMRLQFWEDALEEIAAGGPVRAHEVAVPLAGVIAEAGLPVAPLAGMVTARRQDLEPGGFAEPPALWAYLAATGGALTAQAVRALGGDAAAAEVGAAAGTVAALANWLVAVPVLATRGGVSAERARLPAPAADLASEGLARLAAARAMPAARRLPRRVMPALLAGWRAEALLRMAWQEPARVAEGRLVQSEFARRGALVWRGLTGRW